MIKGLFFLALAAVMGGVAFPLLNEGVDSPCLAVERRAAVVALGPPDPNRPLGEAAMQRAMVAALGGMMNGHLAAEASRRQFGEIPPFLWLLLPLHALPVQP
jgi:hypothetical protein